MFCETKYECKTLDDIVGQVTVLVGCLNINPVWCKIHTGFFVYLNCKMFYSSYRFEKIFYFL